MNLSRFQEFYERLGFWTFWIGIFGLAIVAYVLFLLFTLYVGPYVVGLWLAWVMNN